MSDKKILKRLIKRKKNKENEFLKQFSLSFIFFRILALFYFPNTIYPATPNTQQHHKMKSNPNTECLAKKISIPTSALNKHSRMNLKLSVEYAPNWGHWVSTSNSFQ